MHSSKIAPKFPPYVGGLHWLELQTCEYLAGHPLVDGIGNGQQIAAIVEHNQWRSAYTGPTDSRDSNRLAIERLPVRRMVSWDPQDVVVAQAVDGVENANVPKLLEVTSYNRAMPIPERVQCLI